MLLVVAVLIVLVWAICASVMAGIGSLVLQKLCAEWNISDAFWIGLCLAVGLLQLYHFFRPIDNLIVALLCTLGILGVVLNRNAFVRLIRRVSGAGLWSVFGCVTAILVIAARCAGPVVHYDTGFYGATAVRWFVTYPLVPGLTNLLGQLGLNSNVFLCEAALEQGPLRGLAFHLLVGLFLCALVVRIVQSYVRVLGGHRENVVDYFILPLAVPCIVWILNADLVGTNTDLPTSVISLVGLIALFDVLQEKPKQGEKTEVFGSRFIVATSLFVLIVTFKVTALALAMLGWSLALLHVALLNISWARRRTLILASIGLSCVLTIPWLLRGLMAPHPLARIKFDNARVPAGAMIGAPGQGFRIAMATLDVFRIAVGAAALGLARRALDETVKRTQKRSLFGAPLSGLQMVQASIAEMASTSTRQRCLCIAPLGPRTPEPSASLGRQPWRSSSPPSARRT